MIDTKPEGDPAELTLSFGVMLFMADTKQRFKKTAEELVLE